MAPQEPQNTLHFSVISITPRDPHHTCVRSI